MLLVAAAIVPFCAAASADIDYPDRFQVHAEIQPLAYSDDGRYTLRSELRGTPESVSTDGRFALKQLNAPEVSCDSLVDLFANGFEGN
jgi:hypothetical protein